VIESLSVMVMKVEDTVELSLSQITLKFLMSLIQCFSSMAWNAHDFNDPTLSTPGISNCRFLTIDFQLLNNIPPGFLL